MKLKESNEGSVKNIALLIVTVIALALLYLAAALASGNVTEAQCSIPNLTIYRNPSSTLNLNLKDFCLKKENDTLQFQFPLDDLTQNIAVTIEGSIATLIPHADFVGDVEVRFTASDSFNYSSSLAFNLTVAEPEAEPELAPPIIIDKNDSQLPEPVIVNISSLSSQNEEIQPIQGTAEVGKPVKWTKKVKPRPIQEPERAEGVSVAIPSSAFEVKVKNDGGEEIQAQVMLALQAQQENATLVINDNNSAAEYDVEYFTEAPLKEETGGKGTLLKNVRVYSTVPFHYSNVKAFTTIIETAVKPSLYHLINGTRVDVTNNPEYNATFIDTNYNGLYDSLEWNIPQLSEQLFEIGLASINTRKSIYRPGEKAEIVVVVLDNSGHLVGKADVTLNITSPKGNSEILNGVETQRGIYEANYSATGEEGNYTVRVAASGPNVNNEMSSYFTVKQNYEFDILRETPVTTDPWKGPFTSTIRIVSFTNSSAFDFTETLPAGFTVIDTGGATVTETGENSGNRKRLTWGNLQNNSIIAYKALPPLATPMLHEIGPALVGYESKTFQEARPWLLAVDPAGSGRRQQKTVEYFIFMNWSQNTTTSATAPYRAQSLINAYIPEDNPTLKSAWVDFYFGKTGASVIGGNSGLTVNGSHTWAFGRSGTTTGEYQLMNYLANVTSRLAALGFNKGPNNYNFSFNVSLSAAGGVIMAPNAKLYLTYEYDDSSQEQLFTARRFIGQLNTSDGLFSSATTRNSVNFSFPNTSQGMPPSAVIRDAWLELFGVVGADTLTDQGINVTLDNEYQGNSSFIDMSAGGPASFRFLFKPGSFNPNLPHAVNISVGGAANNVTGLSAELVMSYSYNTAADTGRLETIRYYVDQNSSSFAAAGATQGRGVVVSLPQKKLTVQDAYVVITGHLGVATSAATDASRRISYSVSRPGVNNDIALQGVNLRHSSADGSQNIMSFRLLYNASTLIGLSDGNTVNCTVAVDGSGLSSPGCELIITYNYSYPDSPYRVKTVGFFAGSSGSAAGTAGPIAAAITNISTNFTVTYPADEGTITNVSPYIWVTSPNVAVTAATSHFNQTISDSSVQSLLINNPDIEQFFAWGLYNATELINTSTTSFLLNITSPTASTYNAWAWVTYKYTIDTGAPNATIILPLNGANVTGSLLINASINDSISPVTRVNATFYNTTGNATAPLPLSLGAGTSLLGYWNITFDTTALRDGMYNLSLNATDEIGNTNITANLSIMIDNTFPVFPAIIIQPNPANHSLNNVSVNWSVSEVNPATGFVNVTYPNGTVFSVYTSNFTLTFTDNLSVTGNYTIAFFANDTAGNTNITLINLTVNDVMPPFITLALPLNSSSSNNQTVPFFYNVSDISPIANCTLDMNSGQTKENNQSFVNKTATNNITLTLAEGAYNWFIKCFDYLNLTNQSPTRALIVDVTMPNVTFIPPTPPSQAFINTTLVVNVTHNETNPDTILLMLNGTVNQSSRYASGVNNFTNFTVPLLRDGVYNFSVYLNDTAGNNNSLPNRTVTVDLTLPTIDYVEPTPADNNNRTQTSFVINVTHNETNPDTIRLYINSTVNESRQYNKGFNFTNFSLSNVNEGVYTYYVLVNDSAGNTNQTPQRTIRVDITPPSLFLERPEPVNYTSNGTVLFGYNVSDNLLAIRNCTLLVNGLANLSNTTVVQGTTQNFSLQLDNGTFSWAVGCYDLVDNLNLSETRNVTVDTTVPLIQKEAVNASLTSINVRVCINATVTDTFTNTSQVLAEISKPQSGLVNFTLTNTSSCGNAGGGVYALEFLNNEDGNYTWNRTYARDKAGNMNSSSPQIPINWTATTQIFLNATMLQPTANVTINESNAAQNYSYAKTCNVVCRQDSTEQCENVNLKPQLNNGTWNDITNISGQLLSNISAYPCGNLAVGAACNTSFEVRSSATSGATDFPARCRANSTNAPISFSIPINLTVNDPPLAAFTSPKNNWNISGIYRLNASASTDDRGMATFRFELDDNPGFTSSTLLCSSPDANCTLDTTAQTECQAQSLDCYLKLNITDRDAYQNVTVIRIQVDNVPPTVSLNSPENNSYIPTAAASFNYTPSDKNIGACTLYHNASASGWAANETNTTLANLTSSNFSITLTNGNYLWNVFCNDTAGNSAFNLTNFTLTVDTALPNITFGLGTEANDTYFNRNWVFVNVTVNESNLANITFYLYNTTHNANVTNLSGPAGSGSASVNFTGINSNMAYAYNVTLMDKALNRNITATRIITLDSDAPLINYSSNGTEANDTYFNRDWIFINVSVTETNFNNISFYLYNSTFNLVNITNYTTQNFSVNYSGLADTDETYYYNVTVRDKARNENSTETRRITLDSVNPLIALNEPANNTLTLTNSMLFNYTPQEANLQNCSVYANFSGSFSLNTTNTTTLASGTKNTIQPSLINDGTYIWNIRCYDKAGNNAFNNSNYTLRIDATPPATFNLSLQANNTQSINVTPTFEWNQTNETHFTNYTLRIDNDSDFSSANFTFYIFNITNTSFSMNTTPSLDNNTKYYWLVTAYDNLSHATNSTQIFTYITDNTTPQTFLESPAVNYSETSTSQVSFKYNFTDANDVSSCSLILNDQVSDTQSTPQKLTSLTFVNSLSNGIYNWSVNCTDTAGNINSSEARNISIGVPVPNQPFDMIAYNTTTGTFGFPKYRTYATSFSAEANGNDSSSAGTTWLALKSNPVIDEFLMGTLDTTGDIVIQKYNQTHWTNLTEIENTISTTEDDFKGFDIAYEQASGRAVIVYNSNSAGAENYTIWNRTEWQENGTTISDSCAGTPRWIEMDSLNNTNRIAMMYLDSNGDFCAQIWNGSSWINSTLLDAAPATATTQRFDIAYEKQSGDILAVWESVTAGIINYCQFNSTTLTWCSGPQPLADRGTANTWIKLASDPGSNKIMLGTFQTAANNDVEAVEWNGTEFGTFASLDLNAETTDRVFDVAYTGNTGQALAVWVSLNNDFTNYSTCSGANCASGTWTTFGNTTLTTNNCGEVADLEFVQLDSDPYSNRTMMTAYSQTTHFVCAQEYNGSSWGAWNSNLGSGAAIGNGEQKMFQYNRFRDTIPPNISFISPTPANRSFVTSNTVTVNLTATDDYEVFVCWLEWNGANETMSMTRQGSTSHCSTTKTGLADANYSFRAYANDTSGNINQTALINITVDTTPPAVNIVSIIPNPANFTFQNASVNWTATDIYINTSIVNVTYPNGTLFGNFTTNFTLTTVNLSAPGNYTLVLFANDSAGNTATDTKYLFVNDTLPPSVNLNIHANDTYLNMNRTTLYYTPQDAYNVTNCTLMLNSTINQTNSTIANGMQNNFSITTALNDGVYQWRVNCSDTFNNINLSEIRTFTVDTEKPLISLNAPIDNFNTTNTTVILNWTANDTLSPTLRCNATMNSIAQPFVNSTNQLPSNYSLIGLSEGVKAWNITCADRANNTNTSQTRLFAVVDGPQNLTIRLAAVDNASALLLWSNASSANYYEVYISTNHTTFSSVPNSTGIVSLNYTDNNASQSARRFYNVRGVRSDVNKSSNVTAGKHTLVLPAFWNMVSLPLTINNFSLKNSTNPAGYDLAVSPLRCVQEIWRYNESIADPWEVNIYENDIWTPAAGDENFTRLEGGRGYWLYNNISQSCNLSFVGTVPTNNISAGLNSGFNLQGWYSEDSPALPTSCQPPYPLEVSPANSLTTLYYYNTSSSTFKGTMHFTSGTCPPNNDWGWFPDSRSGELTSLTPSRSYYFKTSQIANWTIQSTR